MKKFTCAALTLAGFATSAMAADMTATPVRQPVAVLATPAPPVFSWTGCYVGGGLGFTFLNQDTSVSQTDGSVQSGSTTQGERGWSGTIQGGCDYQFMPGLVIGAFADGSWGDVSENIGTFNLGIIGRQKMDHWWAVGGRLGYVPFERLLVYTSGGFTQAHFGGVTFIDAINGTPQDFTNAYRADGAFLGAGYEYGLTWLPGLFWKTEYRFSWFNTKDVPLFDIPTGALVDIFHTTTTAQEIRSELVWRFNWGR
jgi:outer membrane immunogenic protein